MSAAPQTKSATEGHRTCARCVGAKLAWRALMCPHVFECGWACKSGLLQTGVRVCVSGCVCR
eukprot:988496-Pleurochrysis_carterae.AAC.2